jgi:hypothetical protein
MLNSFEVILNRDDCSDAQAEEFMAQGIQRIQRDCRLPSMERAQVVNIGASGSSMILVPQDLVQLIDIIWQGPRTAYPVALKKLPYRDLLRRPALATPQYYGRLQGQYWLSGTAASGDTLQLIYYGNFSDWTTADSDNELSASTPDLGVYAALSYAGDHFECSLAAQWEARFQAIKAEVIQMSIDLDAEGGEQTMQPIYHWD